VASDAGAAVAGRAGGVLLRATGDTRPVTSGSLAGGARDVAARRYGGVGSAGSRRSSARNAKEAAVTVIAKYMHEAFIERCRAATPALAQGRRSCGARPSSGVER
jgi:hypothetical protein